MKKILIILLLCLCIPIVNAENQMTPINEVKDKPTIEEITEDEVVENDSTVTDSLNLAENAKSAIMIEASTGKVIYEKNADEQLSMASMTKMMTLLLIMENIDNGNLKWDEMITTSEYAASMGGSQIFLEAGEQMTVEDLVKGICIGSGNDVAVTKKQSQVIGEEPTNHLDLNSREVLEENLLNYKGTLLFVSHDRYFLEKMTNKIWNISNKKVETFDGNYMEYLEKKKTIGEETPNYRKARR